MLTLTPEGRDLLERTLRLLREAERIEQGVAAACAEPGGTLKVTAPLSAGVNIRAPALPAFYRQHPKGTVELRLSERYVDLIKEGVDVAIRVGERRVRACVSFIIDLSNAIAATLAAGARIGISTTYIAAP
ncbi:LysR substrate-binding domain-containing protein [Caballeronia sp. J97]|uniref:LysR substrate-binding domain-containing protein n=1 Tax=Caballeronia sp. J97 TaxID=2805429 RepID=UPI002AAF42B1|nr:LysR substrate-binding domain-containing protein [Caballeronia sp. J97]